MLNIIRCLVHDECGSVISGEITINDKDLFEHCEKQLPNMTLDEIKNSFYKLKRSRCIRVDAKFIGEDIYHAELGDTVYRIKLLKNSIYH